MAQLKIFDIGTAIQLKATLKSTANVLMDVSTNPTCTVIAPSGIVIVDGASTSRLSAGVYNYIFQSSATHSAGEYTVKINAIDGSYTSIVNEPLFVLQ